jgi:hypothetical protein
LDYALAAPTVFFAPKPRNSTRSRLAKAVAISSKIDPIRNRGEHMRILLCDALNQF